MLMFMMLVAGRLVGKIDPRAMAAAGYFFTALGVYNLTRLDLTTSYATVTLWRALQVMALPIVFIPISTLNYIGVPPEKSNQISSLSNFARNIGGSAGTALLTTFIARTSQTHQQTLAANVIPGSIPYTHYMTQVQKALVVGGMTSTQAASAAVGYAYRQMQLQATMLSYKNAFVILSSLLLCLAPLPFVMRLPKKRDKPSPEAMGH
jgi:MFS transporter, DHA2 family, multidrug resistance protein